jgi:hypothetical protein
MVTRKTGVKMILEMANGSKRKFDVNNKKDVEMYKNFLTTRRWGGTGCPFVLEFPHMTIPDMIKDKMMDKYMKIDREE